MFLHYPNIGDMVSIALRYIAVSPVLKHWRYRSVMLSHRYVVFYAIINTFGLFSANAVPDCSLSRLLL